MDILIKNGRIIDPANGLDEKGDILVEKGVISKIGGTIQKAGAEVIDAKGKICAPGFIDMHTHLREPGREDAETVETASRAAVRGGFTTVCAMPNTTPPCDSRANTEFIIEQGKRAGLIRVIPIGTITKGRKGEELSEMAELQRTGCPAVSDDGDSVEDASLMQRALEYASMLDLLVISHCEDKKITGAGVMREGYFSTVLGLAPIPKEAESTIVARDISLAERTGARIHIAHVSCSESVEIIREAKKRGVKVTAEVTPHHLALMDKDLKGYDTNMKVNPPLAGEADVKALKKAVKDGTIDVIATDHAPHPEHEKEKEFDHAPFGMIGLETALPVIRKVLIEEGDMEWPEVIEKLASNPARILGCGRGTLSKGAVADIVMIDPEREWIYEKEGILSKSVNSPFIGTKMKGQVTDVVAGGRHVLKARGIV
ncbi:MAG: dihydroorotase [Candidatus Omnitrophota bacterium]|nr:dihydroorotase [Candidatus Omnitrophota bacterium]